jgi:nicotinate phosphoribosyltransferase
LIDTYDTIAGAHNSATVGKEMAEHGDKLIGVRIDSGDLPAQARAVRKILDESGLRQAKILGSGGGRIQSRLLCRAALDATASAPDGTSRRAADRHVVQDGRIRRPSVQKLSTDKISKPGRNRCFAD